MTNVPPHLGGHNFVTHIDLNVLNYFVASYNVKSMLDIGCGPGGMRIPARDRNVVWTGIDGDHTVSASDTIIHDFTKGPITGLDYYDLGWSVEFLEHVKEKYIVNYMPAFQRCKKIVVTHALPWEKTGHHHVNLKDVLYWVDVFAHFGFTCEIIESQYIRKISSMKKFFMAKTGIVFTNEHYPRNFQ